jgi:dTDP-4-amino-4,6-dideoxygalactose transaminase
MPALAIAGGTPVRRAPFTPWPQFDDGERAGVLEVLESRAWGGYPFPNRHARTFAGRFAAFQGARYGLCAANGTVTLEIALKGCGLRPGDEVLVPAYTFEATAVPVLRLGGTPVFVDVRPDTYCLDVDAAAAAVTPRTRGIMPVHLGMGMADMDAVAALADRHGLFVIEDCAHAHGAAWRGRGAGSIGTAGSFSMQTGKLVTAGEGGAVLTNDDDVFEACQAYANCGRLSETDVTGERGVGFNYRMTDLQAAILLAQLGRLESQAAVRTTRAARLVEGLASIPGVSPIECDPRVTRQAIYQFILRYDADAFGGASRDRFVAALELEGIPCDGVFYEPLYRSPLFRVRAGEFPAVATRADGTLPWSSSVCPIAERAAYREAVWLPHPLLLGPPGDVDDIVEAIGKIQRHVGELIAAEHPLIAVKGTNRAERDRVERRLLRES